MQKPHNSLFKIQNSVFIQLCFIIFLSFASFWRIFGFGLWKDDWSLIWSSLYNTHYYHGYFNHPGTPLEFFFLSRLFETNALFWQSVGFIFHILVSILVGICIQTFTQSKKAGFLAGIFFACSYLGLETIYFASVHVIQLAAIPLLLSLIYFIRSITKSTSHFLFAICYLLLALLLDPPRIAPMILVFPFLLFLVPANKTVKIVKKIMFVVYPIFFIFVCAGLGYWFVHYSLDTLLGKVIHQGLLTPSFLFSKSHVLGHFFATIANIFTGLIYSLGQDEQNTGIYSRFFGYLGVGIFLCTIFVGALWIKTKKQSYGWISFFLFWIFLFYIPNFLSEPRAPMAGAHRYVFLTSIGFIGLVAYLISYIKNTKLLVLFSVVFVAFNIFKANTLLAWQYTYRSDALVHNIWTTINAEVPKGERNNIFMFFGAQPWVSEDIGLSGQAPYALLRKNYTDPTQMPIFTVDTHAITKYLCFSHIRILNLYFTAYTNNRIPLSHIHAWNVLPGGELVNISEKERTLLKALAEQNGCKLI